MQLCRTKTEAAHKAVKSRTAVIGDKGVERVERRVAIDRFSDCRGLHAVGTAVTSICGYHKS